jgi:3-methylfumaryl-CoA hydratase
MTKTQDFSDWIGRKEVQQDCIDANRVQALAATLDVDITAEAGGNLPPLWHWIFFNPRHKASELGHDGHARKGGFLPPIELPRRMWAGGRFEFIQPLMVGDVINRVSTIKDIKLKDGKSGQLAFVTVEHDIRGESGGHWIEEHDIVYKAAPDAPWEMPKSPEVDTEKHDFSNSIKSNPVLLFRYSALTFNGHRIHYDREYCQEEEGYPGLIVHGPLTATMLIDLVRPYGTVKTFKFRALRPLFDHLSYSVHGRIEGDKILLWTKDSMQQRAMEAEAWI